jgi:hypothetical protein
MWSLSLETSDMLVVVAGTLVFALDARTASFIDLVNCDGVSVEYCAGATLFVVMVDSMDSLHVSSLVIFHDHGEICAQPG